MDIYKHKVNGLFDVGAVTSLENKLLFLDFQGMLILISDVVVVDEEERYGRKDKKVRTVQYLYCKIVTWNPNGEFIGAFDKYNSSRLLCRNLYNLRKKYLDFKDGWTALHAREEELNVLPIMDQVIEKVKEGLLLEATKIYKEATGKTLKQSKDYIFQELKPIYYP